VKVTYGKQQITQEDIEAVISTLKSDFLTQGPKVTEFESAFAEAVGSKFAVAINNATSALHLAFKILNKDLQRKVISTPLTFVASTNCVLFEGGQVDFVDIDPKTLNLDLNQLEDKVKKNTSSYQGVVAVDFAGLPVDTENLKTITEKYGLWAIEDACHAIGGAFKDSNREIVKCGSSRNVDITAFSFHPVKHIATGEGGMLTTNDEKTYKLLLKLRSHGMERDSMNFSESSHGGWYHEMQSLGYNYRMPDINAALGTSQLKRLSDNIKKRNLVAKKYKTSLAGLPLKFQEFDEEKMLNAYHLFVVQTEKRKELFDFLKSHEIYSQVHYLPVYWHPYYQQLGFKKGLCPHVEKYYNNCLSLPMYHSMTDTEQDFVIGKINEFFSK